MVADRRESPETQSRSPQRYRTRGGKQRTRGKSSPVAATWDCDRGRPLVRKLSNPYSKESLKRRGYHTLLSSFGKVFHVEKRWKLVREMGSGAYGFVISAADDISGETVAIKLVTRVLDKTQLAKRALREITLLRHFANHANITGLIDLDAISPDFNEIYIFMEPMEADLHQIIRSEQVLSNEHVQYFVYQVLRGMKFVHSANVIHRDLKPGNLLVNADCELKICDFGLSRGFDSSSDENPGQLTEYVATRWYRAPELMLTFRGYTTAIDVWSIGCILAELFLGGPLFKGKDYVDQLNKILDILGTPNESVMDRIGSEKAQAYVRSLPRKDKVPFSKVIPSADPQAIDLLDKMLTFDPNERISVPDALKHPWLSSFHDENEEPDCSVKFDKWRKIEELVTLDDFRQALWEEIEGYRREVRKLASDLLDDSSQDDFETTTTDSSQSECEVGWRSTETPPSTENTNNTTELATIVGEQERPHAEATPLRSTHLRSRTNTIDPVVSYARRSVIYNTTANNSTYSSPVARSHGLPPPREGSPISGLPSIGDGIPFPGSGSYVFPRTRTMSTAGGEVTRKLMRTLSTVSIHERVDELPGGLAGIGPIGRAIVERETPADAPTSGLPGEFGIEKRNVGTP